MYNNYTTDKEMADETKMMSKKDKKAYGDYNKKMMAEHDVKLLAEAGEIKNDKNADRKPELANECKEDHIPEMGSFIPTPPAPFE